MEVREALEALQTELRCAICLTRMVDVASIAGCGHVYCRECIEHGLRMKSACPLCKRSATKRSLRQNDQPDLNAISTCVAEMAELLQSIPQSSPTSSPRSSPPSSPTVAAVAERRGGCCFCGGHEASELLGRLHAYDGGVRAHESCALWSHNVFIHRDTGQLLNIGTAFHLSRARHCHTCRRAHANVRCAKRSCGEAWHLPCAVDAAPLGVSLQVDARELWCGRHGHLAALSASQQQLPTQTADDDDGAFEAANDDAPPTLSQRSCGSGAVAAERRCCVCERFTGDLLSCDSCARTIHLGCHTPPLRRLPLGEWHCAACVSRGASAGAAAAPAAGELCITSTGLDREQKALLRAVCARLSATLVDELEAGATHVVVGAEAATSSPPPRRTAKLLHAIVRGCHVMFFSWVRASDAAGGWLLADAHSQHAAPPSAGQGAPQRRSRRGARPADGDGGGSGGATTEHEMRTRAQQMKRDGRRLFEGCAFHFGAYKKSVPSVADLRAMVELGGGVTLSRLPRGGAANGARAQHVYNVVDAECTPRGGGKRKRAPLTDVNIQHVDELWIMDAILS